jgi:predicted DNA-binding ribbon-helix-helix protein
VNGSGWGRHLTDDRTNASASRGIVKRSVAIAGHRTSISLEEPFWDVLREIARSDSLSVQKLIVRIDADRGDQNLSSAIRVFVLNRLRGNFTPLDGAAGPAGV